MVLLCESSPNIFEIRLVFLLLSPLYFRLSRLSATHGAGSSLFLPVPVPDRPRCQRVAHRVLPLPHGERGVGVSSLVEEPQTAELHVVAGRGTHGRVDVRAVGAPVGERNAEGDHFLLASGELHR